jgi:calcium-dependent protein kinase
MHKIKKAIYSFIASRLTEEETKNLKNIFENIDVDHDGKISFIEMKNAIKKLNIPNTENEIESIFKSIDTDNNGNIDYTEFLSASLSDKQIMNKKTLLETFNMFDKDKSGKISKKNIVSVLHLNNEKIAENYIKKYDLDKDGEINYQEFLEMMEKFGNFNENKDK